jgi:hypothetical protein
MIPKIEQRILQLIDSIAVDANDVERDARVWARQILALLKRIDDSLATINRRIEQQEKRK